MTTKLLLILTVFCLFLTTAPRVLADLDVAAPGKAAHDYLHQALGLDQDTPPSVPERIELLNKAKEVLEKIPPGHYGHHRVNASRLIDVALDELKAGDVDKATETIREADEEVRSLEVR